jgi:hypothetical protein
MVRFVLFFSIYQLVRARASRNSCVVNQRPGWQPKPCWSVAKAGHVLPGP